MDNMFLLRVCVFAFALFGFGVLLTSVAISRQNEIVYYDIQAEYKKGTRNYTDVLMTTIADFQKELQYPFSVKYGVLLHESNDSINDEYVRQLSNQEVKEMVNDADKNDCMCGPALILFNKKEMNDYVAITAHEVYHHFQKNRCSRSEIYYNSDYPSDVVALKSINWLWEGTAQAVGLIYQMKKLGEETYTRQFMQRAIQSASDIDLETLISESTSNYFTETIAVFAGVKEGLYTLEFLVKELLVSDCNVAFDTSQPTESLHDEVFQTFFGVERSLLYSVLNKLMKEIPDDFIDDVVQMLRASSLFQSQMLEK